MLRGSSLYDYTTLPLNITSDCMACRKVPEEQSKLFTGNAWPTGLVQGHAHLLKTCYSALRTQKPAEPLQSAYD